jgi:hypothetical protein
MGASNARELRAPKLNAPSNPKRKCFDKVHLEEQSTQADKLKRKLAAGTLCEMRDTA